MFEEQFCKRLTELRQQKGVSARDMSLSLGQSEAYVNRVENRRMLPSMTVFFYICDYFGITPAEFFADDSDADPDILKAVRKMNQMDPDKREHLLAIIDDL